MCMLVYTLEITLICCISNIEKFVGVILGVTYVKFIMSGQKCMVKGFNDYCCRLNKVI